MDARIIDQQGNASPAVYPIGWDKLISTNFDEGHQVGLVEMTARVDQALFAELLGVVYPAVAKFAPRIWALGQTQRRPVGKRVKASLKKAEVGVERQSREIVGDKYMDSEYQTVDVTVANAYGDDENDPAITLHFCSTTKNGTCEMTIRFDGEFGTIFVPRERRIKLVELLEKISLANNNRYIFYPEVVIWDRSHENKSDAKVAFPE